MLRNPAIAQTSEIAVITSGDIVNSLFQNSGVRNYTNAADSLFLKRETDVHKEHLGNRLLRRR